MSRNTSLQRLQLWLFGPSLASILFYFLLFQRPLQHETSQQLAKLNRLHSVVGHSDSAVGSQRLVSLESEVKALTSQLEEHKASRIHLIARRGDLSRSILGLADPATSIADLIGLLERNQLRCHSAQPSEQPQSKLPEALQAVASSSAGRGWANDQRDQLQFELQGTFYDMQRALRELKSDVTGVRLVSLEMKTSADIRTDLRCWLLTVAIGRSLQ